MSADDAKRGSGRKPLASTGRGQPRKAFLVRLSPELLTELRGWAAQELRSLNAQIEYLLQDAVRRRRGPDS
jgi:hypothetical protein